jgi:hypothetical protein
VAATLSTGVNATDFFGSTIAAKCPSKPEKMAKRIQKPKKNTTWSLSSSSRASPLETRLKMNLIQVDRVCKKRPNSSLVIKHMETPS